MAVLLKFRIILKKLSTPKMVYSVVKNYRVTVATPLPLIFIIDTRRRALNSFRYKSPLKNFDEKWDNKIGQKSSIRRSQIEISD